jgi:hypothetical protein
LPSREWEKLEAQKSEKMCKKGLAIHQKSGSILVETQKTHSKGAASRKRPAEQEAEHDRDERTKLRT